MIGQSIAHYKVTAKLGAGGMGEVYRATATDVTQRGESLEFGRPKPLFDAQGATHFDTKDGRTFLLDVFPQRHKKEPLQLILNWQELLKTKQ